MRRLAKALHREYPRSVGGGTWIEIVTFCYASLYELAPRAAGIEAEVPEDPYDLSAWRIRQLTAAESEVRYQFHTRNLEMTGLLRALARTQPRVTLTLVTLCLGDSSVASHQFSASRPPVESDRAAPGVSLAVRAREVRAGRRGRVSRRWKRSTGWRRR